MYEYIIYIYIYIYIYVRDAKKSIELLNAVNT